MLPALKIYRCQWEEDILRLSKIYSEDIHSYQHRGKYRIHDVQTNVREANREAIKQLEVEYTDITSSSCEAFYIHGPFLLYPLFHLPKLPLHGQLFSFSSPFMDVLRLRSAGSATKIDLALYSHPSGKILFLRRKFSRPRYSRDSTRERHLAMT